MGFIADKIIRRKPLWGAILFIVAGVLLFSLQGCGSDSYDRLAASGGGDGGPGGGGAVLGAPENGSVVCSASFGEDASGNSISSWVTLDFSATDDGGVTGYYVSENPAGPAATGATCAGGGQTVDTDCWNAVDPPQANFNATGVNYALEGGFGDYTVYIWFRDADGNVSAPFSGSITYIDGGGGCG